MEKVIEFRDIRENDILIDVRTKSEFLSHTIPSSINVPLFTDEERTVIGNVYVNESVEEAKRLGICAVSKRLINIYDEINKYKDREKRIVLFCARGGLRSSTLYSFLNSIGLSVYKLKGGYKAYRSYIVEELPKLNSEIKYVVLSGKTGTGKTHILKYIRDCGYDVLDLEECANHRGSLLGSIGLNKPESQKNFESNIYNTLKNRKSNIVFVEGESKRIGNSIIPNYIYQSMQNGIYILIEGNLEYRAKILCMDYIKNMDNVNEILNGLDLLKKYINENKVEDYKEQVRRGEYEEVAKRLITSYYDPLYGNKLNAYNYALRVNTKDIKCSGDEIINFIGNYLEV